MLTIIALALPCLSEHTAVSLESSALPSVTQGHVLSHLSRRIFGEATPMGASARPPNQEVGHSQLGLVPVLRGDKDYVPLLTMRPSLDDTTSLNFSLLNLK